MNYKITAIRLLLLSSLIFIKSPTVNARDEHAASGARAAPAARASEAPQREAPAARMSEAPQREAPAARMSEPVQRHEAPTARMSEPVQRHEAPTARMSEPVQRHEAPTARMSEPVQRHEAPTARMSEPEQRHEAPTARMSEPKSPREAERQTERASAAPQSQKQAHALSRESKPHANASHLSSHQIKPQTMRGATAHLNSAGGKHSAKLSPEKNGGNVNRARQIAQRDQKAAKAKSSAHLAAARSSEKSSEKNGGNINRARQIAQRDQKAAKAKSSAHLAQAQSPGSNKNKSANKGRMLATVAGTKQGHSSLSRPSALANPRKVSMGRPGSKPGITYTRPHKLAYRSGASNIPRAGRVGTGRAGIVDPGGYVRTAQGGRTGLSRNSMQQQLSSIPNYNTNYANTNRSRVSNHSQWPGQWNPGASGASLGYFPGYSWNGTNYPFSYYACSGYCSTPYLFLLECGAFWQPGVGYADCLPYGYNQPMSIGVDQVVPAYDAYGHIIGYRDETFYYNACWDPSAQAYGYYDYLGGFHWVTFPWLNTWGG
jgi:hypothetical protein